MSEVAPLEPVVPEDSLAGHEALPTLFDSALPDEPKTSQADALESEPAARIDDGLSEDDDEPRLLTRAQKKSGKARIVRTDSKADETYSPRVSSSKGGKKRFSGKRGSKNLPKPVIVRKPVPTIIPVKEVPFLYDRILAALPQVDKQYYDSYAVQNLTICSILEVEKYAHEADPEEALFNDLVKIVIDDTSNKYKLTARQKNGRVDASWTKTDIGRDPMEVLSRYNELMMGDEEKAKRSYRAHNPERKDWTAADLRRFREAFLKYGAGPTSNKKIAQFMGIHPNQIAYIKQRIRRLARQREIETEFDRAAFEMVKDMKNVPDKVLFKHLRDKLIREDEEDKANKAAARKAKKNPATQENGTADQPIEDENNDMAENDVAKDAAEASVGAVENESNANNAFYEQINGQATDPALNEGAVQDRSPAPSSQLASPEPSRSTEVSPTAKQRKRTKPQSTEKQAKRRKTEHTPPKRVANGAAPDVLSSPQSNPDATTTSPLPSPTSSGAKNRLTEREQRLLKRKHSVGKKDDDIDAETAPEDAALLPPSRKKRNSGGEKAKQPTEQVNEISKSSKSVEEEAVIADTTSSHAPEPLSSADTNGLRSTSQSEPVTPREFNPEVRPARAKESSAPPPHRDYPRHIPAAPAAPVTHIVDDDDDGPAIMSRYATPHSQLTRPPTSHPPPPYTAHQGSAATNRPPRPPRPASPQPENTHSIPMLLSDTPARPMKHQWAPEPFANAPMQFNYSASPFPLTGSNREMSVPQQLPNNPISITPHIPAALMRTTNPTPANRSVPMVPQRTSSPNIPPLGTPLSSFPMAGYANYQNQMPNYAPTMQRTLNTQHVYNFNNGAMQSTNYPTSAPKQPQYSMVTSPRDFEAALTPFLMNSADFSAMNANQSAQQYSGPYSMVNYPPPQQPPRQYEMGQPKLPTTFVPYVNNNAK